MSQVFEKPFFFSVLGAKEEMRKIYWLPWNYLQAEALVVYISLNNRCFLLDFTFQYHNNEMKFLVIGWPQEIL